MPPEHCIMPNNCECAESASTRDLAACRWATVEIDGYRFVCTGPSCPEQYDVWVGTELVGYVRLRFGSLSAHVQVASDDEIFHSTLGAVVYERHMSDRWIGEFESAEQRMLYLTEIRHALHAHRTNLPGD